MGASCSRWPTPCALLTSLALCACPPADSKPKAALDRSEPDGQDMLSQRGKVVLETRGGKELLLDVEIASNDRDRGRGLMFRRKMPELSGMIFVFPHSSHLSFWMKNTLLPLDIVFIDEAGVIVGVVENAEPRTLSPRQVAGESKLVLEVNGGFCARHGVRAGDTVELQGMYRLE